MTSWDQLAEAVLPAGSVRRVFDSVARVRRWRDAQGLRAEERRLDHLETLWSAADLGVAPFKRRAGVLRERLRLRRHDGQIFLDRWGIEHDRVGGIFVHKMSAPDPGVDLHDHPWWFASLVLRGGYVEERAMSREAPRFAQAADRPLPEPILKDSGITISMPRELFDDFTMPAIRRPRGVVHVRHRGSVRTMRLDECHRITELTSKRCWTLVVHGPRRRLWGFFLPSGWVDEHVYDDTVRAGRRDLWNEAV